MVSEYGRHSVRAETGDGVLIQLPLAWTTLIPRPDPLELQGQAVRLAPEALYELAKWVAARVSGTQPSDGRKLAVGTGRSDNKGNAGRTPSGARSTAAVVGQARSPSARRRGGRRKRGAK